MASEEAEEIEDGEAQTAAESLLHRRQVLPASARCEKCDCADISPLPTYAAGSGIAQRPIADDVFCHRCGHIAAPTYALELKPTPRKK